MLRERGGMASGGAPLLAGGALLRRPGALPPDRGFFQIDQAAEGCKVGRLVPVRAAHLGSGGWRPCLVGPELAQFINE